MQSEDVCLICLAVDVRMYPREGVIDLWLESLFSDVTYKSESMPNVVCFECVPQLRRFHKFREKFLAAQNLLYEIIQAKDRITKKEVRKINRKDFNLKLNLSINHLTDVEDADIKSEFISIPENTFECSSPLNQHNLNDVSKFDDDLDQYDLDDNDDELWEPDKKIKPCSIKIEPIALTNKKKVKTKNKGSKKSPCETKTKKKSEKKTAKTKKDSKVEDGILIKLSKLEELAVDFEITKFVTVEEQIAEMEKRKETQNYKQSPYKCEHCYHGFIHEETLKNHLVYHAPKKDASECPVCHMQIRPRSKYNQHMLRHNIKFQCKSCDFLCYGRSSQASLHAQFHKGVEYTCEFCPATFKKLTSQQTHTRTQHRTSHVCATCGYSFVSERGLKMHQAKTHKDTYKYERYPKKQPPPVPEHEKSSPLYCAECDMKFSDEDAWTRHRATSDKHTASNDCMCRHCGQQFPSAESRSRHGCLAVRRRPRFYYRRFFLTTDDITYPRLCELLFQKLKQHRLKHLSLRTVQCTLCPKKFYEKSYLKLHMQQMHSNKRPYPCKLCGKCFKTYITLSAHVKLFQKLKQHRLKHLSLRTVQCTLCPKKFYEKSYLKLHMQQMHSNKRPYPCKLCGKCFKTYITLSAHVKRHEGIRRFACPYCEKAFKTSCDKKQHVKHVHMNKPKQMDEQN